MLFPEHRPPFSDTGRKRRSGFTLLEVILSISIAIGILVVALVYYRQATHIRSQLLDEADRLSAVRLVMDLMTADFRAACENEWETFAGDGHSLRFLRTGLALRTETPESDLRLIHYAVAFATEGTNQTVAGITRQETPVERFWLTPATNLVSGVTSPAESIDPAAPRIEPLTEAIRYVRFRYWDGTGWMDAWSALHPPLGVEVSLGLEPLPTEVLPDEYPFELFRRVIALPGGRRPLLAAVVEIPLP